MSKPREFWIDPDPCDEEAQERHDAFSVHPGQGPLVWQARLIKVREVRPGADWAEVEEMRKAGVREVNRITFEKYQADIEWASAMGDLRKECDRYRAALEKIVRKAPHEVSRNEAADMACEFKLLAQEALK